MHTAILFARELSAGHDPYGYLVLRAARPAICPLQAFRNYKTNNVSASHFGHSHRNSRYSSRGPWVGRTSIQLSRASCILESMYMSRDLSYIISDPTCFFSLHAATSSRSLTERRISHIVSVCSDPIPAELPESGIVHLRIPVEDYDFADLLIWLPTACQFIHQAISGGGIVLVHCHQGLTRSAAVVAAYRKSSPRHAAFGIPLTRTPCSNVYAQNRCGPGHVRGQTRSDNLSNSFPPCLSSA
jgi:hypothetical protein